jgi:hypothetical protein
MNKLLYLNITNIIITKYTLETIHQKRIETLGNIFMSLTIYDVSALCVLAQ